MAEWKSGIGVCEGSMRFLISVIILAGFTGCFPNQGPTPQEPARVKAHTRDYPGITTQQVLKASEEIFRLADGSDMNITRSSSALEVKRSHESLVYRSSWERWTIDTREVDGTTFVTVTAEFDKEGSKIYPRGAGAYHLFFARLDYMLGASKNWMTCNQYQARLMRDSTWGHDDRFLCKHANDHIPEGPLDLTDG